MKPSYILRELKVPLIDLQTCSDYFQKANYYVIKPNISEAMICSELPVGQKDQCIVRIHPVGTFQSLSLSHMIIPRLFYLQNPWVNLAVPGQALTPQLSTKLLGVILFALCLA